MARIRITDSVLAGHIRQPQEAVKTRLSGIEALTEAQAIPRNLASAVILAPVLLGHPSNASVTEPATATFTVTASGKSLSYQWYKNGNPISEANSPSYTTPATNSGTDNGASFYCRVSNAAGMVQSNAATLTVIAGQLKLTRTSSSASVVNSMQNMGDGHFLFDPNAQTWSGTPPWKAFDTLLAYYDSDYRACGWVTASGMLTYRFPKAVTITSLRYATTAGASAIDRLTLHGSNNNSTWTQLMDRTGLAGQAHQVLSELIPDTTGSYRYYRVTVYNATGTAPNTVNVILNELELRSSVDSWAGADHLSSYSRSGSEYSWFTKFNNPINWSITSFALGLFENITHQDDIKANGINLWTTNSAQVVQSKVFIPGSYFSNYDPEGSHSWGVQTGSLTAFGIVVPPNGGIGLSRTGSYWLCGSSDNKGGCVGGYGPGDPNVGATITYSVSGPIYAKWN